MKTPLVIISLLASAGMSHAADATVYTNFLRQVQLPSTVEWDASATVGPSGSQLSDLAINPGGARFDLWTVKAVGAAPLVNYLLDTAYVGSYVPLATVVVRSEDPYAMIPRTRADRPFYVDYTVTGLLSGASDPPASKSVKMLRHVQSYGAGGTGINIDRTQATLLTQVAITTNTDPAQTMTYTLTSVPGADRSKVRGEERFSIFSILDSRTEGSVTYTVPETQIASQFIQIWPVADGSISGIADSDIFGYAMPELTLTFHDVYPGSSVRAQVYKGGLATGKVGTVVPGSARSYASETLPIDDEIPVRAGYDSIFTSDGIWTMELLNITPFDIVRLDHVTFTVSHAIEVNGSFTTIE